MINPIGMSLMDWADSVLLDNGDAFSFGKLTNPAQWQAWGSAFVQAQPFTQKLVPDPFGFSDWREWAQRAYTMLEGQG